MTAVSGTRGPPEGSGRNLVDPRQCRGQSCGRRQHDRQLPAADDAAQVLVGQPLDAGLIAEAAGLAEQAAQPHTDHRGSAAYKRQLVRVFTSRILTGLVRSEEEAA